VEGPRLNTILTKEETTKEHNTAKLVYSVKFPREIAGQEKEQHAYLVIGRIGNAAA
jgi:hypothetical protein